MKATKIKSGEWMYGTHVIWKRSNTPYLGRWEISTDRTHGWGVGDYFYTLREAKEYIDGINEK